jgi:hypothetical protein
VLNFIIFSVSLPLSLSLSLSLSLFLSLAMRISWCRAPVQRVRLRALINARSRSLALAREREEAPTLPYRLFVVQIPARCIKRVVSFSSNRAPPLIVSPPCNNIYSACINGRNDALAGGFRQEDAPVPDLESLDPSLIITLIINAIMANLRPLRT